MKGPSHFFKFYLQELHQVLTVKISEKSPHVPARGKDKLAIFKYISAFYS